MGKSRQIRSALPRLHAALGVRQPGPPAPTASPGTTVSARMLVSRVPHQAPGYQQQRNSSAAPSPVAVKLSGADSGIDLGSQSQMHTLARLHAAPRRGSLRQWGALVAAVLVGLVIAVAGYDRPQRVDSAPEAVSVASPPGVATESSANGAAMANGSSAEAAAVTGATGAVVHVVGSVHQPGLMALPIGARVSDALTAAGGVLPGTDLSGLNLARRLNDGEQIVVGGPAVDAAQQSPSAAANNPGSGTGGNSLINLNQADSEDLQNLPRVGPATAEKILRYRQENGPFTSIDQLLEVPGIGEATLAGLRDLVAV